MMAAQWVESTVDQMVLTATTKLKKCVWMTKGTKLIEKV